MVKLLQESFRDEQKRLIQKMSQYLVYYISETSGKVPKEELKSSPLTKENRTEIHNLITTLQEKYKYSALGALSLLQHLIKVKY